MGLTEEHGAKRRLRANQKAKENRILRAGHRDGRNGVRGVSGMLSRAPLTMKEFIHGLLPGKAEKDKEP